MGWIVGVGPIAIIRYVAPAARHVKFVKVPFLNDVMQKYKIFDPLPTLSYTNALS